MASATLHRARPLPTRVQVGLVALLLLVAGAGWAVTGDRMQRHGRGPRDRARWPGLVPRRMGDDDGRDDAAVDHADGDSPTRGSSRAGANAVGSRRSASSAAFVAGYLVTWAAAGLLGYAIFDAVSSLDLGFLAWDDAGRYISGAVILGAGLYQLTAPKDACLRHCRTLGDAPRALPSRWPRRAAHGDRARRGLRRLLLVR